MAHSLYIHIPFCASKCNYCSFNSFAGLEDLHERYVEALCTEIAENASDDRTEHLKTIFLGGGTPTLLSENLLHKLLTVIMESFSVLPDAEISIEANPGTVDSGKLTLLHNAGVNRISVGVQAFNDQELRRIGRIHSAEEAVLAVNQAKASGFKNISIDLMYGLPGQNCGNWQRNLETAISLDLNHISLYQLTVEEQTPLAAMISENRLQIPDEDELAAMEKITAKLTADNGLSKYEISNYARIGYQCRHNITYWENRDYFGVGAGAVSCLQGIRRQNIPSPETYCLLMEKGESIVMEEEKLPHEASFRETVVMGLRMNRGVSIKELKKRYGIDFENYYGKVFRLLITDNLLEQSAEYIRLTDRGKSFANRVMAELV